MIPKEIWSETIIDKDVEAVHHFVGLADFDMDGTLDVSTAEMLQGEDPDEVKIYYNDGSGSSWEKQVLSDSGSHSMRILDVDQDGDMDLFGANHNDRKINLWINQTPGLQKINRLVRTLAEISSAIGLTDNQGYNNLFHRVGN